MTMSENKSRVSAPSVLTVVSATPVEPGKTHPLSLLDHSMGLHTIHVIFYYRSSPGGPFDLDRLRISLSEVLTLYPAITGRLTRGEDGNWEVKCNDAGIRVLKAKVGVSLDEWLRSADSEEERDLTVWEDMPEDPYTWSPFRIQINYFVGGGLAIGLSCTHMHADPTSAILILKSWSQAHLCQPIDHPPVFNSGRVTGQKIPNTNTKSASYYATKSKSKTPSLKMASATFRFSDQIIKKYLSQIYDKCPNATPFDLLTAIFWARIATLKPVNTLSICVDFRKHLVPPLPYGYFGNAQYFSQLSLTNEELGSGQVGHVAGLVHHHVASLEEDEVLSIFDWFEDQRGEGRKFGAPFRMYGPELTCVNMESSVYSVMLEKDVNPVHVSCRIGNVDGEGLIMVMESPEGGFGRTVTVTLPEEEIGKLCSDQVIVELMPTMLLSGK